jgi:uncharacterized protein
MRYPEKITVDTSVFINPDSFSLIDKNSQAAFCTFIEKAKKKNIPVYIPPSVMRELFGFLNPDRIPKDLISWIRKKPPKKYEIFVPSLFLYELIEETRQRTNKGLRIAEKYSHYSFSKKKPEEDLIKGLRTEFRTALREGIIDSKQDVDLLILAKELNSPLISADQGLIEWADKLGVESIPIPEIKEILFSPEPE